MFKKISILMLAIFFPAYSWAAAAAFRMLPEDKDSLPAVVIPTLNFDSENILGINVGLRPERGDASLNVSCDSSCGDYVVYHNTGYGASGLTLAPGGAKATVRLYEADRRATETKPIVIGAGCAGLETVVELIGNGVDAAHITVYATQLPAREFTVSGDTRFIATSVGAGFWFPWEDNMGTSFGQTVQKEAFEHYAGALAKGTAGVSRKKAYTLNPKNLLDRSPTLPAGLMSDRAVRLTTNADGRGGRPAWELETFGIDGSTYYPNLLEHLQSLGVKFEIGTVTRDAERLMVGDTLLPVESPVFDCTGIGARTLFGDDKVKGDKGYLLYVKEPEGFDSFIFGNPLVGEKVSTYPTKAGAVAIGHVNEDTEDLAIDPAMVGILADRGRAFFASLAAV